jgi:hypothetical protein
MERRIPGSNTGRGKSFFSSPQRPDQLWVPAPLTSVQWVPGDSFHDVKWPGRRVTNEWIYAFTSCRPVCFRSVYSDNFIISVFIYWRVSRRAQWPIIKLAQFIVTETPQTHRQHNVKNMSPRECLNWSCRNKQHKTLKTICTIKDEMLRRLKIDINGTNVTSVYHPTKHRNNIWNWIHVYKLNADGHTG